MLGLCFHYDPKRDRREHWSWIDTWFHPDEIWEVNQPASLQFESKFQPRAVKDVSFLPRSVPLVVCQPPDGRYVKGVHCIDDFEHPDDAIYYFGFDHGNMDPIDRDYVSVYVPTRKHEFYAAFAAAIVLNDRRAKWDR